MYTTITNTMDDMMRILSNITFTLIIINIEASFTLINALSNRFFNNLTYLFSEVTLHF